MSDTIKTPAGGIRATTADDEEAATTRPKERPPMRYGEVDSGFRPDQEARGKKYGYGSATFLDYLIPDKDPNLKYMAQEPEEHTLVRYIHNRKKVFTWQQVSYAFAGVATLFGGLAITGQAPVVLSQLGILTGLSAGAVFGSALAIAAACGVGAFVAGYYAFRSDMKNDVDIEEMQAKRIGYHVARSLNKDKTLEQAMPTVEQVEAKEAATDKPKDPATAPLTLVSEASARQRMIEAALGKVKG